MSEPMRQLQDLGPVAEPTPTMTELRHRSAAKEYAAACDAIEGWPAMAARDPKDPAYAAVLARYRTAIAEHQAAARAMAKGE